MWSARKNISDTLNRRLCVDIHRNVLLNRRKQNCNQLVLSHSSYTFLSLLMRQDLLVGLWLSASYNGIGV